MKKMIVVPEMVNFVMPASARRRLGLCGIVALLLLTLLSGSPVSAQQAKPNAPGGPGENPPPDDSGPYTLSGVYTVDGGAAITASDQTYTSDTDQTYTSDTDDVSAVYVTNAGNVTLHNPTITTSGNTSSQSNSSFFGLNAAVLATKGSQLTINGGTLSTTGTGANGAIATDAGSAITLSDVTITATNEGGHGVMATNGGAIILNHVNMNTSGSHSAPIATDRGSGTITVTGGTVISSGEGSPGIYATGVITATDLTSTATGSEAVVIEGKNTVKLTNSTVTGEKLCGVMIYQSFSGDAEVGVASFTMTGGALTAAVGPLFYVTNTTAEIALQGVNATAASGTLIKASEGNWGAAGENGGQVTFTADGQILSGDIEINAISAITAKLTNGSALTGAINAAHTGKVVNLTLDATSTWHVTADSYLTCLTDSDGISGDAISNIMGNGHTVFYDQNACSALGGQTYTLNGGGQLQPNK